MLLAGSPYGESGRREGFCPGYQDDAGSHSHSTTHPGAAPVGGHGLLKDLLSCTHVSSRSFRCSAPTHGPDRQDRKRTRPAAQVQMQAQVQVQMQAQVQVQAQAQVQAHSP